MTQTSSASPGPLSGAASKLFVAICFVLTTLFTSVVTVGSNYFLWQKQTAQTQQSAEIGKFVDVIEKFDPLFGDYILDLADSGNQLCACVTGRTARSLTPLNL